jgi:hypothetical protein
VSVPRCTVLHTAGGDFPCIRGKKSRLSSTCSKQVGTTVRSPARPASRSARSGTGVTDSRPPTRERASANVHPDAHDAMGLRSTKQPTPICSASTWVTGTSSSVPERLSIYQDARYPHLVSLAGTAIDRVLPPGRHYFTFARDGCMEVCGYWMHWTCVFPQHGPGVKHRRTIRLEQWQQQIVRRFPRQLLRGLIHSDGCRVINRVRKRRYTYPRYLFTNTSTDILQIFRDTCDAIGVPHRDTKPTTISVARRVGVATLDTFIGPKA